MSTSRSADVLGQALEAAMAEARSVLSKAPPAEVSRGNTRFVPPPLTQTPGEEAPDGWGFKDTRFEAQPSGAVVLTGGRYEISNVALPNLMPWIAKQLAAPLGYDNQHQPHYPPPTPEPVRSPELLQELESFLKPDQVSDDPLVRLRRGHGHTGAEIWAIRYGKLDRVPDLVVFPASHEEVEKLVSAATRHGACLIPFGGGTNVTDALRVPVNERRCVVAVDMRRMNRVLWIDPTNRMACIEAGATGKQITDALSAHGYTMGHEPDSLEFSTLGGWIATNASGMKKNRYGNIEDIVLDMQIVTAHGVVSRPQVGPRESIGVNPKAFMFGSEGNFGIVTSATVKITAQPDVRRYGSVVFPTLSRGLAFLYDLQRSGATPASVRLMDNTQFQFGQALKPKAHGKAAAWKSTLEKLLVTKLKGFDPQELAVATVVFEGGREEVAFQEEVFYRLAKNHAGIKAGAKNGERGYQLTFSIAYIRDLAFSHWSIAESFETSVPWSRAQEVYERVRSRVRREHEARRLPGKPFFSGRFTQVYPTGVCIYFYMGFYAKGVDDPVRQYAEMEHAAREEILAAGGSLSHHHGVGKIRQDFLRDVYSEASLTLSREVKRAVDPQNLFGAGNHGVSGLVQLDV